MVRFLAIAMLVSLVPLAQAETYKLKSGIVVTDNIPDEKLPELVKHMTAKQFEEFAKARNEAKLREAHLKHLGYLEERGPLKTASFTESTDTSAMKIGGGYGAGGYGGAGGYLGYGNNVAGYGLSGLNASCYNCGNYGGYSNMVGNNLQTTRTHNSMSYERTYPDLNDGGGGPVVIINPYCHDYWRMHTEAD